MQNEVIIDGCNVAECEFSSIDWENKFVCEICAITTKSMKYALYCNENKNCYFKQLQRAKAELEQYKNDIASGVGCIQCKKELENDTLHITISKLKADLSQAETSLYAWKAENEKLKKELDNFRRVD